MIKRNGSIKSHPPPTRWRSHRKPQVFRAVSLAIWEERILSVDVCVAMEWGRISALRLVPAVDGLLAATAKVHSFILVTRDLRDVAGLGAGVLNPFEITPHDR
ncbi:MAG: PIN domain-containing protein [Methylocystis sp.]